MICDFAVQKPVSAHGGQIGTILGVVIHVTAGEGDPFNEFANPNNQVSSHFGIGNGQGGMADGLIEQYVDTGFDSWAQMDGNNSYISVETEGEPTDPLTPAQVASFGQLMAWCHANHGVPLVIVDTPGESGFITHGDGGADWGGHTDCPGPLRTPQRAAILLAAGPPTPKEVDPMSITVTKDTNGNDVLYYPTAGTGNVVRAYYATTGAIGWHADDLSAEAHLPPAS